MMTTVMKSKGYKAFWKDANKQAIPFINAFNRRKKSFELTHTTRRKTGKLDSRRLHAYKTSEDLFKNKLVLPKGKRHYVSMMVDRSYSMQGSNNAAAIKDALILAIFCRAVGVDFNVFTYTTIRGGYERRQALADKGISHHEDVACNIVELFSSKMNDREFRIASRVCFHMHKNHFLPGDEMKHLGMGGTPSSDAVITAYRMFSGLKGYDSKTFLFMTDGQSVSHYYQDTLLIDRATNDVYDVKICDEVGREYQDPLLMAAIEKIKSEGFDVMFCGYAHAPYRLMPFKSSRDCDDVENVVQVTDKLSKACNIGPYDKLIFVNAGGKDFNYATDGLEKALEEFNTAMADTMRYKAMSKLVVDNMVSVYS